MGNVIRFAMALLLTLSLQIQNPTAPYNISYRLSMSRPASHLFEVNIEVQVPVSERAAYIDFQIPMWQPGRYSVADFAKNVQEFGARSGNTELSWMKVDNQTWRVQRGMNRSITASYRMFSNDLSGTYAQLDVGHANFTGGELFMYIVGHKPDPVRLRIEPPPNWNVINGRTERPNPAEWQYPNYEIMIDNPTEIGPDWTVDDFKVGGKTYHVVVHSFGEEGGKRASLVRDIEKIVRAETALWGPPEFTEYTFLIHFAADDRSGDGMEHLTSTQIIESGALADPGMYDDTLGTVAHEFFHVWNVKRLRPVGLGPWDFTKPANTRGLWVAEGFTNYYGHLMLRRAGLWDDAKFLRREGQTVAGIEGAQGSQLMSAVESSLSAPFLDDAPHVQQTNLGNTAISYYPKGELIGMVLDLLLRGRTNGKASLDEVMRQMYDEFYLKSPNNSYYLRGQGYQVEDLQRVSSQVGGFDLADFFKKHVYDVEVLPYDEAFGYVGLRLTKTQAKQPFTAGLSVQVDDPQGPMIQNVRNDSPAEDAGLQAGDELVELGGKPVTKDWLNTLAAYKSGDAVPVTVRRDRKTIKAKIVLGEPERFDYRIEEKPGATAEEKGLRKEWLTGR